MAALSKYSGHLYFWYNEVLRNTKTATAVDLRKRRGFAYTAETVAGQSQNSGRMLPFGQPNMISCQPTMTLQFPQQHVMLPMPPMPFVTYPYFDGVPPGQEAWNQSNWLSHQSDGQQWGDQHQEWWQEWWQE